MTDHIQPIFVATRLDSFELAMWRERLDHLKSRLARHAIEENGTSWSASEHVKGSRNGGWRRIAHGQDHGIASFAFAHRDPADPFDPYFIGEPKEILRLYEEALDDVIGDTTSLDESEVDETVNILETHFDTLLLEFATAVIAACKDEDLAEILSTHKLRLSSGAPFALPSLEVKLTSGWKPVLTDSSRRMLQTMMKPIVIVSQSKISRSLNFGPIVAELKQWTDPGPMEKMRCIKRFTTSRPVDEE